MRKSVVSREPTKNVRYLTATSTTKDDTSESKLYSERTGQCKHLQDDLSNESSIGMDQDPPCYPSTSKELVLRKNIHPQISISIYIYIASSQILTANIFDGFWTWPQAVDFISSRGPHGCWLAKRQAEPSGAMSNGGLVRSTVGEITNWKARSTGSSAVNISMKHETSWHQDVAVSFQPEAYLCTGLGPNLPWLFGHRQSFSSFSAMVLVQSDTAELDIWSSRSIHLTSTPLEYQAIIISFIFQRFECKLWDLHRYHRSTGGNRESHSVKCPEIRSSSPKWSF